MKKYETLIFDLDDTLIDNQQSILYAFKIVLNHLQIEYSDSLFNSWLKFDNFYWHRWESGKMILPTFTSLEEKITYLRANRFLQFFESLNLEFDTAVLLNDIYCSMLGVNIVGIEGAEELLQDLQSQHEILIATNGPKAAAYDKVKKAKLDSYISQIISSEEVGFSKPKKEFFDYLYRKAHNKDRSLMLLIGDSLTTDILGGMNNGIDTCWFNLYEKSCPKEYQPTMEITKLLQLKKKI